MERKHNASLHRRVIDSTRQLINQMQQKGRMLRRVFGGGGEWGGCPEREETCRECASRFRRTQRNSKRWAWPNLARLMKNGQESAYLAHPSLSSTAAPPHFLLLPTSAPLLPPLHPPHLPSGSHLYPTLWSPLNSFNPASPQKWRCHRLCWARHRSHTWAA